MRSAVALIMLLLAPAQAAAQAVTLSWEGAVVSDYRFRGVSLSNREPALQGGIDAELESGFYAGLWGSSIARSEGGARGEIDVIAGYRADLAGGKIDANVTWYLYPGDGALDYVEANVRLERELGPFEAEAGLSYAPPQGALDCNDNGYAFAVLGHHLFRSLGSRVTVTARAGYENGGLDLVDGGGKIDWEVGAQVAALLDRDPDGRAVTWRLAYVDSNAEALPARGSHNLAGAGLVASLKAEF